jgi:hypothetical protein
MRVLLALALTLICTAVFSHGSEQWINDAKLVDPATKQLCCGPTDCTVLAPGAVERVQGGYKVNTGWFPDYDPLFIEWDRALPFSPDGNYHICVGADESLIPNVRCFITPPSSVQLKNSTQPSS